MDTTTTVNEVNKDKLLSDLRVVIKDAEELVRLNTSPERMTSMRERLSDTLQQAKTTLTRLEEDALERGKQAAQTTNQYVHEHPWTSVGVAAGIGLLLGMLVARR
jgi:ElaB/YqjD/DUF883 family membrane-anchored ribosome-binding protein